MAILPFGYSTNVSVIGCHSELLYINLLLLKSELVSIFWLLFNYQHEKNKN